MLSNRAVVPSKRPDISHAFCKGQWLCLGRECPGLGWTLSQNWGWCCWFVCLLCWGGQRGSVKAVIAWGVPLRGGAGDRMSGSPLFLWDSTLRCSLWKGGCPHPACERLPSPEGSCSLLRDFRALPQGSQKLWALQLSRSNSSAALVQDCCSFTGSF